MHIQFATPGLFKAEAPTEAISVVVRALLFYEGKHADSIGKVKTYTAKMVEAIAAATNTYLQSGRRAKFFADHEYSQRNVLGAIEGEVTAQEITEVPHKGMEGLIGQMGIYANVIIAGEENVTAYSDGRIKEISVGIDVDGKSFGVKNAIYELSAVGIPALAGAALFALTLNETIQQGEESSSLWKEWDYFTDVLMNIKNATEEELQSSGKTREELRNQAANDLHQRLLARFPPPTNSGLPTVPLFNQNMELTPEELKELQAKADRAEALELENASLKRGTEVANRFAALERKAIGLKSEGKLTPAKFNALGFGDAAATVSKFAAGDDRELDKLEIQLDTIAECATPVKLGSYLSGEGLPGEEANTVDDETKEFFKSFTPRKSWANTVTH